jgi:predicted lipoprotein
VTATPDSRPNKRSVSSKIVGAILLLALVLAMALSTKYVSASAPVPGAQAEFDAAAYGEENYASTVKPAIEEDPVDLTTLVPLLAEDAEAAGEQYGQREGTSPYTYSVTLSGTAGRPSSGLMPVTVPGVPKSTRIAVQVGPAVNGTALRDATGLVSFNDFVNQVEYADAATALNTEMKTDLLEDLDPESLVGQEVTVVGATAPLNPEVITVTPVSIEVTQ